MAAATGQMDDGLGPLRALGRLTMGAVLLVALLMATLMVGHGADESGLHLCIDALESAGFPAEGSPGEGGSVQPRWRMLPPRLDCAGTAADGTTTMARAQLSSRLTGPIWATYAAWAAAVVFAIALIARPATRVLLDRAAATLGWGGLAGASLAAMVTSAAKAQAPTLGLPMRGPAGWGLPGWLPLALAIALTVAAAVAASRAQVHPWVAACGAALIVWLWLVFSATAHPATPRPAAALAAALGGGLIARLVRALRRVA